MTLFSLLMVNLSSKHVGADLKLTVQLYLFQDQSLNCVSSSIPLTFSRQTSLFLLQHLPLTGNLAPVQLDLESLHDLDSAPSQFSSFHYLQPCFQLRGPKFWNSSLHFFTPHLFLWRLLKMHNFDNAFGDLAFCLKTPGRFSFRFSFMFIIVVLTHV